MTVFDPMPPPDRGQQQTTPGVAAVELDRFHLRCCDCGDIVGLNQAALDFGFSATGRWIGKGYCTSCGVPERIKRA